MLASPQFVHGQPMEPQLLATSFDRTENIGMANNQEIRISTGRHGVGETGEKFREGCDVL
jgi:hypothetical protein